MPHGSSIATSCRSSISFEVTSLFVVGITVYFIAKKVSVAVPFFFVVSSSVTATRNPIAESFFVFSTSVAVTFYEPIYVNKRSSGRQNSFGGRGGDDNGGDIFVILANVFYGQSASAVGIPLPRRSSFVRRDQRFHR